MKLVANRAAVTSRRSEQWQTKVLARPGALRGYLQFRSWQVIVRGGTDNQHLDSTACKRSTKSWRDHTKDMVMHLPHLLLIDPSLVKPRRRNLADLFSVMS
jgi:hypothetical protein